MDEYNFYADLLYKFSQLQPWVQAIIGLSFCGSIVAMGYFFKESIVAIVSPFKKETPENSEEPEKDEWVDKYYRDGKKH